MRPFQYSKISLVALLFLCRRNIYMVNASPQLPKSPQDFRCNTTSQWIFSSVSSLLQHWPNTIYRNGHAFVPGTIPIGTLLHHGRTDFTPPPSPEYFAFDVDHSYLFCFWPPCVMFTYAPKRDLKIGYFDGTGAAVLEGPRDFQDILFNEKFIPPEEYDPWAHAQSMCKWANRVGLDGIVRMEPSFEVIICNIVSNLELVSRHEIMPRETMIFPGEPRPFSTSSNPAHGVSPYRLHPRQKLSSPTFPGPGIPVYPPPPGWTGKQREHYEVAFESIRAGMWHNYSPGERRVLLDYSRVVSAYDEGYTSLMQIRQDLPRSKHRLSGISTRDRERLVGEVSEVLASRQPSSGVNWQAIIQGVTDRYAERLADLRRVLEQSDRDPVTAVAAARHKLLVMLTPYIVLPQAHHTKELDVPSYQEAQKAVPSARALRNEPDDDWLLGVYSACANYATAGIPSHTTFTKQEERLRKSLDHVQAAICSSLIHIWARAFDSGDKPVLAKQMASEWRSEVEELMGWLDWHMWVKCDPPCGPGLQCILATWPWEVMTGNEELGPTCRENLLESAF